MRRLEEWTLGNRDPDPYRGFHRPGQLYGQGLSFR